ncbi:nucleoside phosphorylase domain-containing protein [Nemania sp. FL0031]|nr:nucleoside phosphorylase domain-containing protein [Nemania sp. FL0031]
MAPSTQRSAHDYTVAILCAMNLEKNAIRYMLDEEHPHLGSQPGDPNSYTLGELHGHNVVLACLPGQRGKSAAAVVATNMSRSFPSIKWRLLIGIGGGVPSDKYDIRLGDVIIGMPEDQYAGVIQYDLGRETNTGFHLKGFLWPQPARLRNAALGMQSDHIGRDNKIEEYIQVMIKKWPHMASYKRPLNPDLLFPANVLHPDDASPCTSICDTSKAVPRSARQFKRPEIHYGLIASGDVAIESATMRDSLVRRLGHDILCFEMEAAGLMTEYPSMVIRGISAYADSHKSNGWQHYAAATAAACAKELLLSIDPEVALAKLAPPPKYDGPAGGN